MFQFCSKAVTRSALRLLAVALVAGSFVAHAQGSVALGSGSVTKEGAPKVPYRGTALSYSHSASIFTFSQSAEPYYNPTWGHRLTILPEWHFTDAFSMRGRFSLYQEFTDSDTTNTRQEVEVSDVWIDAVWGGWKEPTTGLRLGSDLRLTLPTSKPAQAVSRILTLGPSLSVSRAFDVLAGLSFAYSGRFTYRFNRFTTTQFQGPTIPACGDVREAQCLFAITSGVRNSQADVIHGPSVSFSPHEKFNVSVAFLMQHQWLPELAPPPPEIAKLNSTQLNANSTVNGRDFTVFSLSMTYTPHPFMGLTLGAFTFSPLRSEDSQLYFPIFNRNTGLYLDATFDLEGTVSLFNKEKKS